MAIKICKRDKKSVVPSTEMFKQTREKFDQFRLRFVEVVFGNRIFAKIVSAPNDPQMTLNAIRLKVPCICCTTACESQISLRFALRPLFSR